MTKNTAIIFGIGAILFGMIIMLVETQYNGPKVKSENLLRKGSLLMEQDTREAVKEAMDVFLTVSSDYPETRADYQARFYLAECYERNNLKEAALKKYLEVAAYPELDEKMKKNTEFRIAKLKMLKAYNEEGMSSLLALLGQTSDPILRSEIYTEIGRYYQNEGNAMKAQRQYEIALTENPANKTARINLARVLMSQKKEGLAFGEYERYIDHYGLLDKEKGEVLSRYKNEAYNAGHELYKAKKYTEAKQYFSLVVKKFPATPEADLSYYYLGVMEMIGQNYKKAIHFLNAGVSNSPRNMDEACYMKKGESYFKLNEFVRAASVFQHVLDHYPKSVYQKMASDWASECEKALEERSTGMDDETPVSDENILPDNDEKEETQPVSDAKEKDGLLEVDEKEKYSPGGSREIGP